MITLNVAFSPVQVNVPETNGIKYAKPKESDDDHDDAIDWKEWLWENHRDTLLQAMQVSCVHDESPTSDVRNRTKKNKGNNASKVDIENEKACERASTTTTKPAEELFQSEMSSSPFSLSSVSLPVASTESYLSGREKLRLELLDMIAHVQRQFLQKEGPRVVFGCLLDGVLQLTNSEYGFIGEVKHEFDPKTGEKTIYLQTHAITNIAWNAATLKFYEDNVESGLKFYNMNTLFGRVMTGKSTVIANSPQTDTRAAGIPKGHPPLNHFLGIPFFKKDGEMNGMVGVANKPGGYNTDDVLFLEPFSVTCSNLIEAYVQKLHNQELIDTLEEKVRERTEELQKTNDQLAAANRQVLDASAAQLQHFACMSHEIRTPLNCIIGLSSLLAQDTAEMSHMMADSINMIVKSGELLLAVVNDVLDYAKLESGNVDIDVQKADLQGTLDAVVHAIDMKAQERNITLLTEYDARLPTTYTTDSRRLQQILYNLLGNAIKFGKPDNKVSFSVRVFSNRPTSQGGDCSNRRQGNSLDTTSAVAVSAQVTQSPSRSPTSKGHVQRPGQAPSSSNTPNSKCPFHRSQPRALTGSTEHDAPTRSSSVTHHGPVEEVTKAPTSRCPLHRASSSQTSSMTEGQRVEAKVHKKEAFVLPADGTSTAISDQSTVFENVRPSSQKLHELEDNNQARQRRVGSSDRVLRFVVKDHGKGIKKEDFQRIFQPFHQGSADTGTVYGGTGLGLAVTSRLVQALGGTIRVDSVVGEWSEFTVDLPLPEDVGQDLVSTKLQNCSVVFSMDESTSEQEWKCAKTLFEENNVPIIPVTPSDLKKEQFRDSLPGESQVIYLVEEHLYDKDSYAPLLSNGNSVLVTYGPNFAVPEANAHFRSLTRVLPAEMIQRISDTLQAVSQKRCSTSTLSACGQQSFASLRVLIAEDNAVNQKVLIRMLQRLKVGTVDVVDNGLDAVKREATSPYDVVLMDLQMPIMNGIEACRQIVARRDVAERNRSAPPNDDRSATIAEESIEEQAQHKVAKVVFISAHVLPSFQQEFNEVGGYGFVPKPFRFQELKDMLSKILTEKIV